MNTSWRAWRASFYVLLLGVLVACGSSDTAPTVTLTASPDTITVGESSELAWTLAGDDPISLSLSPDVGVALVSPLTVSPTETTTYTLTATNDAGSSSASVTVTVQPDDSQPEPGAPTIDAFSASVSDLTATFTWTLTASEAVGCTVDFGDGSAVQTLGDCLGTQTITHTYDAAGTYTATLALTSGAAATTSLTVVGSSVTPTDCAADFVITNQSDLNALSGCGVIGSLTIDPTAQVSSQQTEADPITSLAPLAGLTGITRSLVIANTALETLAGLEGLVSVGGDITISNNAALLSLAGLENIAGYDDANTVQVIDNSSLDCSQPALPFSVDVSQGNAVDCAVAAEAPVNSVRFLASLEYLPNLNIFVELTAGISQRITIERYGRTADPLTVQVQVLTPPSTIAIEDIRINGDTFADTFAVTFPATRSRTTFDLRVVGDALDEATETLALAFVETPDYGLVEPAELRFDVQEPVIIADVCRGEIVVTTQSELEQLSECTIIDGNLTIDPTAESSFITTQQDDPIVSLQALSSLTRVTGSLTIRNTTLTSFNGLQSLTIIGSSLTIISNPALESVAALASITTIGANFTVVSNNTLVSLSVLTSIVNIGGNIIISSNFSLVALFNLDGLVNFDNDNDVEVNDNDQLDCFTFESPVDIDISSGNLDNCPSSDDNANQEETRNLELTICEEWSVSNAGGVEGTTDIWDISTIPEGAVFDIRFDTYEIPDRIEVEYPTDTVQLNTGWRGSQSYSDETLYPGGIVSPGRGQENGFFTKATQDTFSVIVTGKDSDTEWTYEVRCRIPTDTEAPTINSFTANPDTLTNQTDTSTLTWDVSGTAPLTLTITPDVGDVSEQDSVEVSPTATTTYTLTASNDSGTVTEEVTVTVNAPEPVAPTISSFTATPDSINSGDTSTLAWEVTEDEPITLTIEPDVGDVSELDSIAVSPTETTTYTLTAENAAGTDTATVDITVADRVLADSTGVTGVYVGTYTCSQGLTGLRLEITGSESGVVNAVSNFFPVASNPSVPSGLFSMTGSFFADNSIELDGVDWIQRPSTYLLVDLRGTVSEDLQQIQGDIVGDAPGCTTFSVTRVDDAPSINSFTATPEAINSGDTSTLAWDVTGDEPVTLTIAPDVGDVSGLSSVEVSPTETTTYTLTASNSDGTVSFNVTVPVGFSGQATLNAPDSVEGGDDFVVNFTGPDAPGDYVTVVAAGAPEGSYRDFFYTSSTAGSDTLTAQTTAGEYEIRYVSRAGVTLASRPITVTPPIATLEAPNSVEGGDDFIVNFTGPDAPGDYVTVVAAGAPEGSYRDFFYTSSTAGSDTLTAQTTAGEYEIRYVINEGDVTIASIPITVTPPIATLEAPNSVEGGDDFIVNFTGPDAPGDYVTVVAAGAPEGSYRDFFYTSSTAGSDTLTAQTTAGEYEIRYVINEGDVTIASIPITVF